MGIDVRHESERGELLSEVADPHGRTTLLIPTAPDTDSRCLRFLDPYGDAVFNQLQLPFLISEVRRQVEKMSDVAAKEHADAILHLLEAARGETHTYVWFIGD